MKKYLGKIVVLGLVAVLAAFALAACGGGSSSGSASASASKSASASGSAAAASGGTLTFGCQSYTDGIVDPLNDTNSGWNAMRYGVTESLFKFDDQMNVQPWLAESCDISDDHKKWTIKLKSGVKFSNGTDMKASVTESAGSCI